MCQNMAFLGLDAHWQDLAREINTTYTGLQYSNRTTATSSRTSSVVSAVPLVDKSAGQLPDQQEPKAAVAINNLFDKKYYEYYLMPKPQCGHRIERQLLNNG